MKNGLADKLSDFFEQLGATLKSCVKIVLQSRRCAFPDVGPDERIVVMGNGPSLAETIELHGSEMERMTLLAVNFAALTDEFFRLKPRYYVMADPVFFAADANENLRRLRENLRRVNWQMTIFVPFGVDVANIGLPAGGSVEIVRFNNIGAEGFEWFECMVYNRRLAMPRPRNVLIPSIMIALWIGYKDVRIVGADHSWTRTLEVDDNNTVISVQPHFYADNDVEHQRVRSVYSNIRLYEIIHSFYVAFKAYFAIERYAVRIGAKIINATPGSFIDAFKRGSI